MKKHVAMKWVKALRSGKYTQIQGELQRGDNSYCCLGVLCEIAPKSVHKSYNDAGTQLIGASLSCQVPVMKWSGIRTAIGERPTNGLYEYSLAKLNDSVYSFKNIADIIEREWKKL